MTNQTYAHFHLISWQKVTTYTFKTLHLLSAKKQKIINTHWSLLVLSELTHYQFLKWAKASLWFLQGREYIHFFHTDEQFIEHRLYQSVYTMVYQMTYRQKHLHIVSFHFDQDPIHTYPNNYLLTRKMFVMRQYWSTNVDPIVILSSQKKKHLVDLSFEEKVADYHREKQLTLTAVDVPIDQSHTTVSHHRDFLGKQKDQQGQKG